MKWKQFSRYWPFVRGIHRSPVNSPHKDQWRGALMFSLICAWINGYVNNGEGGDLRRHRAHYDVTIMMIWKVRLSHWDASVGSNLWHIDIRLSTKPCHPVSIPGHMASLCHKEFNCWHGTAVLISMDFYWRLTKYFRGYVAFSRHSNTMH